MLSLRTALTSTPGKKFVIALTGLGTVFFVITHLIGNLSLYQRSGESYNMYTEQLHSFGPLLTAAELGLVFLFLLHIAMTIATTMQNRKARPTGYRQWKSKGAAQSNVSSRNMIWTGLVLLVFLVIHIKHFRFGAGISEGYVTQIKGMQARDLHRLVVETFQNPVWVIWYVAALTLLGLHIRHGFWSMFQSLGLMNPRFSREIQWLSVLVALLLAVGFLGIPIWIYFNGAGT